MDKKCSQCGELLKEGNNFCENCGKKILSDEEEKIIKSKRNRFYTIFTGVLIIGIIINGISFTNDRITLSIFSFWIIVFDLAYLAYGRKKYGLPNIFNKIIKFFLILAFIAACLLMFLLHSCLSGCK